MTIACGICRNKLPNYNHLIILPCRGFHVVCSDCLKKQLKIDPKIDKDNCWLFGRNCDSKYHHFHCRQCESPNNVFHIPDNNLNNLVHLDEYNKELPFEGLSHLEHIKTACKESIKDLESLILNVNAVASNCRISRIVGSSVGVVGSVLFVTGAILTPFTLGASTPLMIAGGVIGGLGSGVSGGTSLTELFINKDAVKTTKDRLHAIINLYRKFIDKFVAFRIKSALCTMLPGVIAGSFQFVSITTLGLVRLIQIASDSGSTAIKVSSTSFRVSSIAFHSIGSFLFVIGAVIDIATIVSNSKEISESQESEFAETIRNAINEIRKIETILEDFINPEGDFKSLDDFAL